METNERLYRSKTEKVIGGVAGGLAEYFDLDVVLMRVVFVLLALFGGGGVLIYIVMWIIIPAQEGNFVSKQPPAFNSDKTSGENKEAENSNNPEIINRKAKKQSNAGLIAGVVLIFLGLIFLFDRIVPWYNLVDLWPLILVFIGVLMIKPDIFKPTKKLSNEI
ncbi:MAG: PspC domain-containing protein [Bacteroidetes bacterium]|nr:PspC domain-containing protein [Bacteroidota bacterium]